MDTERTEQCNVICESRKKLYLSGVTDTESFDEKEAVIFTLCGKLQIKGADLKMIRLSVEEGEAVIEGEVDSLIYSDVSETRKESFLTRLFR